MPLNTHPLLICRRLFCLLVACGLTTAVCAQDSPASAAAFRWGADQEGGGPYIYPRDDNPTQTEGFEVDLAAALGRELKQQAVFVQCSWNQILPMLDRRDIDLALNGYEFTAERAQRYQCSLPYYVYELGLCVRKRDSSTQSWTHLKHVHGTGEKKRVGVLEASAADRFITERFGDVCEVLRYEGSTEALRLVETGQLDATVQDLPVLKFYVEHLRRHPELAVVDKPEAPGYYVLYARADDRSRIEAVNAALRNLYRRGELRDIYEKYGIWNATQEKLPEVWETWLPPLPGTGSGRWSILELQIPLLIKAAGVTVVLALLSMPLAVLIGLTATLVRSYPTLTLTEVGSTHAVHRLLSSLCTLYVEVVRGTPLAFQLFVIYFVLPELGLTVSAFCSGVIALAVNYSAYEAEIFRLGLQAIPRGQMEAALALGMSRPLALRRILLPQAVRIVIPASANDFIALFKDTAVCSVIAVEELSKQYSMGAKSTGLFLEMAMMASALYLLMSYPLSLLAGWLERKLKQESHS